MNVTEASCLEKISATTSGCKALNLCVQWIDLESDPGKHFPFETLTPSSPPLTFPNSTLLAEDPNLIGNSWLCFVF